MSELAHLFDLPIKDLRSMVKTSRAKISGMKRSDLITEISLRKGSGRKEVETVEKAQEVEHAPAVMKAVEKGDIKKAVVEAKKEAKKEGVSMAVAKEVVSHMATTHKPTKGSEEMKAKMAKLREARMAKKAVSRADPPGDKKWIQEVVGARKFREGAFTKKATAHQMTPMEFAKEVHQHPDKYDLRTKRQAQFLLNIQ